MYLRTVRPFLLFLFISSALQAQWNSQNSGTSEVLRGVHFTNALSGWGVGNNGTIVHTGNGGNGWSPQSSGSSEDLYYVHFTDSSRGWAVGLNGTILHTDKGGNAWGPQASGTGEHLTSVNFPDSSNGWAVGGNGTILHKDGPSSSWSSQSSGTNDALYEVHFTDPSTGWVVGENGTILHTDDGGASWTPQTSGTSENLQSVYFTDSSHGWAVGWYGTVLHTSDGGINWNSQVSGTTENLYSVHFADTTSGWLVGIGGTVRHTDDSGSNWTGQSSGTGYFLTNVHSPDGCKVWSVGENGTVLHKSSSKSVSITRSACHSYTVPSDDETYTSSGTYTDTIPTASGCDSLISIGLTVDTVDTTVVRPSSFELLATANNVDYQWLDCDDGSAPISGATDSVFAPDSSGEYAVEVTENGCTDTSACYTITDVGIEKDELRASLHWYPNPTEEKVTIDLRRSVRRLKVIIRDLKGRKISEELIEERDPFEVELGASPGPYVIELIGQEEERATLKVLKE